MNEASFFDHAVRDEGLYIRGMITSGRFQGQMVEIFVDREDAEMFGWIDPLEEEVEAEDREGLDPALEEALNVLDDETGMQRIGDIRERTDLILPTTWQEAARRQAEGLTRAQGRKTKSQ